MRSYALFLTSIISAGIIGSACGGVSVRATDVPIRLTPPSCVHLSNAGSVVSITGIARPGATANETYRAWERLWLQNPECQVVNRVDFSTRSGDVTLHLRHHFTKAQETKIESDLVGTGRFTVNS